MSANGVNPCTGRYAGCTADPPPWRGKCDSCNAEHNRRAAERCETLKAAGKCIVCGARASTVAGHRLTLCPRHRVYYQEGNRAQ